MKTKMMKYVDHDFENVDDHDKADENENQMETNQFFGKMIGKLLTYVGTPLLMFNDH